MPSLWKRLTQPKAVPYEFQEAEELLVEEPAPSAPPEDPEGTGEPGEGAELDAALAAELARARTAEEPPEEPPDPVSYARIQADQIMKDAQKQADALVAAASILLNIQTFASRNNDPLNPLVVTVGEMHGGQRFNIIANHVEMYGTVRTIDPEFRQTVETRLRKIIENTAEALGCKAELIYEKYCSPIVNDDDDLTEIAQKAVESLYGDDAMRPLPMMMGSEDFCYFADKAPSVFGFLGSRCEAMGLTATNHNDHYNVDESTLKRGAAVYAQFAADYLEAMAK